MIRFQHLGAVLLRSLSFIFFAALFFWILGLAVFVHGLPVAETSPEIKTDAIIVLTGGNARVERGFDMLAQGAAPVLLISGVGKDVSLQKMLQEHATAQTRQVITEHHGEIALDYISNTTATNAREVSQFVRERGFHSIRLITALYHMPRSVAEIQAALPDVTIVADPVFPEGFQRDQWWLHKNSRDLIIKEFHKSLAVWFRPVLQHYQ